MEENDVRERLEGALRRLSEADLYLLENDLSERCIAARLAMYLQDVFPDRNVDVEYNRAGDSPKRLELPDECANYEDADGRALVVPDVIVHRRGAKGPNILVLEVKKTTNPETQDCDRKRVCSFRKQLEYEFGALISCETRAGHDAHVVVSEWFAE